MRTTFLCVLLAGCSWGRFDDLKHDTAVGLAERPDGVTGNIGVAVAATGRSGAEAGAFVAAANGPAALVRYAISPNGDINEAGKAEGAMGGGGDLNPLNFSTPVTSIAPLDTGNFVVGVPASNSIVVFGNAVSGTGRTLFMFTGGTTDSFVGTVVAAGDLGLGGAEADVAAGSRGRLYVMPDGATAQGGTSCQIRQPQPPSINIGPNVSALTRNVAIATIGGQKKVIVSGSDLANDSWVKVIAPPTGPVDTTDDCAAEGIHLSTNDVNAAPFALAVGDVNGDGAIDLVTATLPPASAGATTDSTVCLYLSLSTAASQTCIPIPKPDATTGVESKKTRGTRLLLANLDGQAGDEIIVGDPSAGAAGQTPGVVAIYKLMGGTPTLVQTLFPRDPDGTENFGRDLAAIPFKQTTLLAVGMNDKVVIYFKPFTTGTDPRD